MLGLVLSVAVVAVTIAAGFVLHRAGARGSRGAFAALAALSFAFVLTGALLSLTGAPALAADGAASAPGAVADTAGRGLGFLGMALATGLACIGAGVAVGSVGSAALGLVGEKPDMLGVSLIYVGLAEGVAIYGIVISVLIMGRL